LSGVGLESAPGFGETEAARKNQAEAGYFARGLFLSSGPEIIDQSTIFLRFVTVAI